MNKLLTMKKKKEIIFQNQGFGFLKEKYIKKNYQMKKI